MTAQSKHIMTAQSIRTRSINALILISVVALCVHKVIHFTIDSLAINNNDDDDNNFYRRHLTLSNSNLLAFHEKYNALDPNCNTDEDYSEAAALAANSTDVEIGRSLIQDTIDTSSSSYQIQNFTLTDALGESRVFESTFCILLYDPLTDKFLILHSRDNRWKTADRKLFKAIRSFTYILRKVFPQRFTPESEELVIPIGGGDYPQVRKDKIPHTNGIAPLLMFGSVFRDIDMYPSMIAMPMPDSEHLDCFASWATWSNTDNPRVCREITTLVSLSEAPNALEWDSLIPQLVWRGTDFSYLGRLKTRPSLIKPSASLYVDPLKDEKTRRAEAVRVLNEKFDTLLPRWKGIALTANAEEDTSDSIPWANMRFSSYLGAGKTPTIGSEKYALWESVDIATGEHMSLQELAKYKYHIDLGGGGGTTWSGTIEKLGMPGLLFHHVTPTKDYIHDYLIPWKHYIPVSTDLKDLKQKFNWAESHPVEAKRIADASTDFMRELSTPQGYSKMFEQAFVEPLQRVIDAYQPVASVHDSVSSWREVFQSMGRECRVLPVMECTGTGSCQMASNGIKNNKKMNWIKLSHLTDIRLKTPK